MMRVGSIVFCAAIAVACSIDAKPAQAAGGEYAFRAHDLVVNVDSRWAGCQQGGYYPIRIKIVNRAAARRLTIEFVPQDSRQGGLPTVRRTIDVEQNASAQFTLSIPMTAAGSYGMLNTVEDGDRLSGLSAQIPLPEALYTSQSSLLVISSESVDLKEYELFYRWKMNNAMSSSSSGYYYSHDVDCQVVPPSNLPDSWIHYSGLDFVAVSMQTLAAMPVETRQAILHWTQCGGNLIVYGVGRPAPSSEELLRLLEIEYRETTDGDDGWDKPEINKRRLLSMQQMESAMPAFGPGVIVTPSRVDQATPALPDVEAAFAWKGSGETPFVYAPMMMGMVLVFENNPFPGSAHEWNWLLETLGSRRTTWAIRHGITARAASDEFLKFLIPNIRGVPVTAFLVLITAFTFAIGPLNYYMLRRRKRLYLLVLTIPVIAFLTSTALFGYSAIAHGFSIKSRVRSLTFLNQRNNTAIRTSRISLFAGMAPSEGLRFSPETAVFPIHPPDETFPPTTVDWTETQHLESGWLRSRTRTQFLTISRNIERGRLSVDPPAEGSVKVANGLEWDIEALVVADPAGKLYFGVNLPVGATTQLAEATEPQLRDMQNRLKRYPLEMPHAPKSQAGGFFVFSSPAVSRMYADGTQNAPQFETSRMESQISYLARALFGDPDFPERSYVAVMSKSPGIELGVEAAADESPHHVLVGVY